MIRAFESERHDLRPRSAVLELAVGMSGANLASSKAREADAASAEGLAARRDLVVCRLRERLAEVPRHEDRCAVLLAVDELLSDHAETLGPDALDAAAERLEVQ